MNEQRTLTNLIAVDSPDLLQISNGKRSMSFGAQQTWYPSWIKRFSGCGPTTCSNLFWYLSATRPEYRSLCQCSAKDQVGMLCIMEAVWNYVKPGFQGVNKTGMFAEGAHLYARERGIELTADILDIPAMPEVRPARGQMVDFLVRTFDKNVPVAFLNLSNGDVTNLESWHWVTLIAVDANTAQAQMLDEGRKQTIDIGLWLETTTKGGGLVALY